MADDNIDKALPNVEQTIKVPGEEEIAAAETEVTEDRIPSPDDVEVTQTDDGGAEINFENNLNSAIHAILQLYGLATGTLDFDKHMQSHVHSALVSQK